MPDDEIVVLFASMSGTAEMVADEIGARLESFGLPHRVVGMQKASEKMLERRTTFIICSSTYGNGDVPDAGVPFYDLLTTARPDLSHVRYGVVALGDMTYSASFCGSGVKFDDAFADLGAHRLLPLLEHDSRSGTFPEDAALVWLDDWLTAYREHSTCAATDSRLHRAN